MIAKCESPVTDNKEQAELNEEQKALLSKIRTEVVVMMQDRFEDLENDEKSERPFDFLMGAAAAMHAMDKHQWRDGVEGDMRTLTPHWYMFGMRQTKVASFAVKDLKLNSK